MWTVCADCELFAHFIRYSDLPCTRQTFGLNEIAFAYRFWSFYIGVIRIVKNTTEDIAVASKERGQEVNVDKNKYSVMPRDKNAGRIHSMKIQSSTFERVE